MVGPGLCDDSGGGGGEGALVKFGNRNIIRPGRLTLGRAAR